MSEPTIRPALEAEEWADGRLQFTSAPELIVHDDGDGLEFVVYPDAAAAGSRRDLLSKHKIEAWATDDLAALIALANDALRDDDPRKVTRETVTWLRVLIEKADEELRDEGPYDEGWKSHDLQCAIQCARQLADLLESYLPPETPA